MISIGVLGGIGPEATCEFYNKLITTLTNRGLIRSNRDFPQIVINSIPAPELIYENITPEELVPYVQGLKELDTFGVDFIVMVCNTIHLYFEKLQEAIETPILDLREAVRHAVEKQGCKTVFVLGTPNTVRRGLYRFDSMKCLEPSTAELNQLSEAIFNFNRGFEKEKQVKTVKAICQKYLDQGAEAVILGCTEFAVMLDGADTPTINTIDVLVDATIERC